MEEKRKSINAIDSFKCFLFSLVIPILFSAVYSFLVMILSIIFKIDYEVFTNHWLVKGFLYILNSLAFLSVFLYYYKKQKISFNSVVNIKTNYNYLSIIIVVGLAFVLTFGFTNFINLCDHLYALVGYAPSGDLPIKLNTFPNMLVSIVLWAVIPAICEELLFRGLIYKGLEKSFKPHFAIIIGGALFMLMHGSLQQTIYQFVLGVVLCTVYYYTKNIFYPILLHFLNNAIVIVMGYLQTVANVNINVVFSSAWSYIWPVLLMVVSVAITIGLFIALKFANKNKYEHIVSTETEVFTRADKTNLNIWWITSVAFGVIMWILNTISTWIA